jgi:RNA polymerase sigma-70 factor (ECF subfamily)
MRQDKILDEIEALYRRRHHAFFRVARAITGDAEAAAEAVQDGFANAIRSRRSYRGEGPLEGWVWRAVVNAARKSLRPAEVDLAAAGEGGSEHEAPALVHELAPLIAALPDRQRTALFLRYYADLDYGSIATALGIEVGTVSATLAAAHRAIRRTLQEVAVRD